MYIFWLGYITWFILAIYYKTSIMDSVGGLLGYILLWFGASLTHLQFTSVWWDSSHVHITKDFARIARLATYPLWNSWVFRRQRYRQQACIKPCRTGTGLLCSCCGGLIARSRLLTGARWPLVWPNEMHQHHSLALLRISAQNCQMCRILLLSLGEEDRRRSNHNVTQSGQRSLLHATESRENPSITIRIWEDRTWQTGDFHVTSQTYLQASYGSGLQGEVMPVQEGKHLYIYETYCPKNPSL